MSDRIATVCVIVPTYNRAADYLDISLASIAAQTRPADEIIVVDDGSTDDTASVVAAYGERIRRIHQPNQGRPAALNTGIQAASSDYFLLFDDDDVLLPDALESHLDAMGADGEQTEYIYSRYFVFDDESGADDIWQRARWRHGDIKACEPEQLLIGTMQWIGAMLSSMLVSRRCFEKVGLFSTELLRAQDYEWQVRLARACRGRFLDRQTFVSRIHEGERGPTEQRIKGAERYALSHRYEQKIFRGIREEMPLAQYLPRDPHAPLPETISADERNAALLTRSRIMFARGLFVEGAADIGELLCRAEEPSTALIEALDELVLYASNIGEPDYQHQAAVFARALCRACRKPASLTLLRTASGGLYWTALRARRQRNASALPAIVSGLSVLSAQRFYRPLLVRVRSSLR